MVDVMMNKYLIKGEGIRKIYCFIEVYNGSSAFVRMSEV